MKTPHTVRAWAVLILAAQFATLLSAGAQTAVSFDGVDDYMEVGPVFADLQDTFTMELWVEPRGSRRAVGFSEAAAFAGIGWQQFAILPTSKLDTYPSQHSAMGLSIGLNGVGVMEGYNQATSFLNSESLSCALDGWNHVALVSSNRIFILYVNGRPAQLSYRFGSPSSFGSRSPTHPSADVGYNPLAGGSLGPNWTTFSGTIDELRIWRTARGQAEIVAGMRQQATGQEPDLAACFHFDEATGNVAVDSSPRHLTAKLVNGVSWVESGAPLGRPWISPSEGNRFMSPPLTLRSTVNPNGRNSRAWFEWGETSNYGQATTAGDLGPEARDHTLSATLTEPPAGRTYHYRLVVEHDGKRTMGTDEQVTLIMEGGKMAVDVPQLHCDQNFAGVQNTFTMECWVFPRDYRWPTEESTNGVITGQSFAILPSNGTTNYGPGHAGAGLSIGLDGVSVCESANNYLPALLVHRQAIKNWTHVAVVYLDGQPSLYINGQFARKGLKSPAIVHPSLGMEYFRGMLDDIRIWNVARTGEQIRENMARTLTGGEAGLTAYINFDVPGNPASIAVDLTYSGYDLKYLSPSILNNLTRSYGMPAVLTGGVTNLTSGSAKLRGTINPRSTALWGYFLYGPELQYRTASEWLPVRSFDTEISAVVSGLPPGEAWPYRVVAESSLGRELGGVNTVSLPFDDGAIQCDGQSNYVALGAAFSDVARNFTMECWVKPQGQRTSTPEAATGITGHVGQRYALYPLMGKYAYGDANHAVAGVSIGTNGISVFEHGEFYLPSPLVHETPISGWNHVAVVYSLGQPSLYLNGNLVRTGVASTKIVHPTADIGSTDAAFGGGLGFFQGEIDEVRIWRGARTREQIQATMSTALTGSEANLLAYYRYNGTDAEAAVDSSGHRAPCRFVNSKRVASTFSLVQPANSAKRGDSFPVQFTAEPLQPCVLEGSLDLVHWVVDAYAGIGPNGVFQWTDTNPRINPQRFFRIRKP